MTTTPTTTLLPDSELSAEAAEALAITNRVNGLRDLATDLLALIDEARKDKVRFESDIEEAVIERIGDMDFDDLMDCTSSVVTKAAENGAVRQHVLDTLSPEDITALAMTGRVRAQVLATLTTTARITLAEDTLVRETVLSTIDTADANYAVAKNPDIWKSALGIKTAPPAAAYSFPKGWNDQPDAVTVYPIVFKHHADGRLLELRAPETPNVSGTGAYLTVGNLFGSATLACKSLVGALRAMNLVAQLPSGGSLKAVFGGAAPPQCWLLQNPEVNS